MDIFPQLFICNIPGIQTLDVFPKARLKIDGFPVGLLHMALQIPKDTGAAPHAEVHGIADFRIALAGEVGTCGSIGGSSREYQPSFR